MTLPVPDVSKNLFDLNGFCSIVTGAGKGIGLTLSQALAHDGSDLVLVGRSTGELEAAADTIRAIGRKARTVVTDVTAEKAPEMIVNTAMDMSRRIDVLINNAGFMTFADMLGVDDKIWDDIYSVNVRAPMRIMKAVLKEMVKAGRGSVINMGSSWSSRASVFNQDGGGVDYCSSKAALQALTRAAAQDVAAKGVRVNNIAPGAVDTPMHADHRDLLYQFVKYIPMGRMGVAEDLAGTAVFLASDASTFITGQTIHVNGGMLMVD